MPNTHSTLTSLFSDIADAIRDKKGTSAGIVADDFPDEIASIPSGGDAPVINPLSVTANGTYTAPSGVDGYSPVTVNVPQGITPTGNINITDTSVTDVTNYATAQVVDADLVAENIKKDVNILGVVGTFEGGGSGDSALVLDMDFEVPEATSAKQYVTLSNLADLPNGSYKAWVGVFTYKGAYPTAPSKTAYVRTYCLAESHANSEFYMGKNLCLSDVITTAGGHDYYVQYGNQLQFDYIQRNKVAIVAPATQGSYQIPAGIWNLKLYTLGGGALT